jgi:hypothetical protein
MNAEELRFWRNKYDKEEDAYNKGIEEELRAKFQKDGFVTKSDLLKIVEWKFQGRLLGRRKRVLGLLENVDENLVRDISALAFRYKDDEARLRLMSCIKGIGNALCSVVLAFYDPNIYGVLDIHAWREDYFRRKNHKTFSRMTNMPLGSLVG